jgi:hypothetical protein
MELKVRRIKKRMFSNNSPLFYDIEFLTNYDSTCCCAFWANSQLQYGVKLLLNSN